MKFIKFLMVAVMLVGASQMLKAAKSNYEKNDLIINKNQGDKLAVLVVHYGTTHADTEKMTIQAFNKKLAEKFPQATVKEAYTSRMIIKILKNRGINKLTPAEALAQLKKEGYTHVVIQSSNIIDGIEMETIRHDIAKYKSDFKEIRLGNPLLYKADDYKKVAKAMQSKITGKYDAVILIGHGTNDPITASYTMMDYILKDMGLNHWYVTTIEGYPTFDETLKYLKAINAKTVCITPFLFVAGEHAKRDINGDWKEKLEKNGFKVTVFMEGLGQNSQILDIFAEHVDFAIHNKKIDIMAK